MTRGGIEYNFSVSPFTVDTEKYTFVFSSQLHADKFREGLKENRQRINESLSNRFNIYIYADEIADFLLYGAIERRGYLIKDHEGRAIKCQNEIHIKCERAQKPDCGEKSVTLTSGATAL
mgnify:CR=1 FL=1